MFVDGTACIARHFQQKCLNLDEQGVLEPRSIYEYAYILYNPCLIGHVYFRYFCLLHYLLHDLDIHRLSDVYGPTGSLIR